MEERKEPATAVRYKFKFSPLLIGLCAVGLVLCATCLALTTWQLVDFVSSGDMGSIYDWIKYALLYLVSILLAVIIIAMLIRSQYVVTDRELIMQFGVIKQKYELKKIYSVHLFRGSGKLAVYFDDLKTNYMVIVVKEDWYTDFVRELTDRNPHIAFSFSTAEEEEEVKKKK